VPGTKANEKPKGTTREEIGDRFSSAYKTRKETNRKKADGSLANTHTRAHTHTQALSRDVWGDFCGFMMDFVYRNWFPVFLNRVFFFCCCLPSFFWCILRAQIFRCFAIALIHLHTGFLLGLQSVLHLLFICYLIRLIHSNRIYRSASARFPKERQKQTDRLATGGSDADVGADAALTPTPTHLLSPSLSLFLSAAKINIFLCCSGKW